MLKELRQTLMQFPSCKILEFYIMIYGNSAGFVFKEDYVNHILCGYRFNIRSKRNSLLNEEKRKTHLIQCYVTASWFDNMKSKYSIK